MQHAQSDLCHGAINIFRVRKGVLPDRFADCVAQFENGVVVTCSCDSAPDFVSAITPHFRTFCHGPAMGLEQRETGRARQMAAPERGSQRERRTRAQDWTCPPLHADRCNGPHETECKATRATDSTTPHAPSEGRSLCTAVEETAFVLALYDDAVTTFQIDVVIWTVSRTCNTHRRCYANRRGGDG